jgi:hypothetical protein
LSNVIWNALPAGAVTLACSNAIPEAEIATVPASALGAALADPDASLLGAGATDGAGVYVQPGVEVTQPAALAPMAATRATSVRRRARYIRENAFRVGRG